MGPFPFDWEYSLLLGERDPVGYPIYLFVAVPCVFCASPGMCRETLPGILGTYLAGV